MRSSSQLLSQLDQLKTQFDSHSARRCEHVLRSLQKSRLVDAEQLILLHETLLFLRAYPQSRRLVELTERFLAEFPNRISDFEEAELDLTPLDHPELSGMAGRSLADTFSYFIVRWLSERYPRQLNFYWDWFEDENRLGEAWPRFMPLILEDSSVEANVPYREWLRAARGKASEVSWLISRFNSLATGDDERAELYDSQKLYVQWTPSYRSTRTGMRLPSKMATPVFYHREPLLQRRDVAFAAELEKPSARLQKLSNRDGLAILDLAREASTVRYRELYGFTHGDRTKVLRAELGRGVDLFVSGVPANRRLPLRAYHAAMIFKNRVPIGYFEGLSLAERMESGFNLYYTFREGETAWLYARTMNVMRHLLGVTTFSLDPYQIGFENEEGIASGAFWFYRKLGFRSTDRTLMKLTEQEENKIRARSSYRTSAPTLRKLATASMIFELYPTGRRDWDRFQVRRIGLKLQNEMARSFQGDAAKMRSEAMRLAGQELGLRTTDRSDSLAVLDLLSVLLLIRDLTRWSRAEKQKLKRVVLAKMSGDERSYLRLMQRHDRFRRALIELGSN